MILGKYHLRERLGVGGMAEVFRAEVMGVGGFHRTVALKKILPHFLKREDFQRMFIDEARICASLTHTNLVQIFDFDRAPDGTYYLTMELIEGVDLRRLCDALAGPMPPTLALHITFEVLKGLAYAHERRLRGELLGLIHRDVTPSNILLSWAGEVKLSDFGLAKAKARLSSTQPGIVKGKFAYLAPEQLEELEIDGRVDIFALGIVLWEMLTGKRLFYADSDAETLKMLLGKEPEAPSLVEPRVPKDCDAVVLWMLQRNRATRPRAREALKRTGDLLHRLATRASHVDLSGFLGKTFAKQLSGHDVVIPQQSYEEEPTRQIDGAKLRELSRTIPNFPLSSPLFRKAREEAKELSKDRELEALTKGKPRP